MRDMLLQILTKNNICYKTKGIENSLAMVQEGTPNEIEEFKNLGLLKYGIMKRTEFLIQNIIDICAVLSPDLKLE